MKLLQELRTKRNATSEKAEAIFAAAEEREGSLLTDEERAEVDAFVEEIRELNERIADLETVDEARKAAAEVADKVTIRREAMTYDRGTGNSYFRDLTMKAGLNLSGHDGKHEERLRRHSEELDVELPARAQRREDQAHNELRGLVGDLAPSTFEKRAASSLTSSAGYIIPPLWLIDDYIKALRFGRPFANSLRQIPLPEGTNSINVPKIATGTLTGVQTADNTPVASRDIALTFVNAPVRTIAGQSDISLQTLEQSSGEIVDQMLFEDLIADYNQQVDIQALSGSGANGQLTGIANWSGINTTTFTASSPAGYQFYTPVVQAASVLMQARKLSDGIKIWAHPRRGMWLVAAVDSQNRPLVTPGTIGLNTMLTSDQAAVEGYLGMLSTGFPLALDGNITTSDTTGGGSGQDVAYAVRGDDIILFEGSMRMRSLPEILSGSLGVRFQLYNYAALAVRYAQSITVISGTGMSAPSGF